MKKILLLTTGGTIASVEGGNGLKPELTGKELIERIPEAAEICKLTSKPVILNGSSNGLDSTNIQPENWVEIAKAVYNELVYSEAENYGRTMTGTVFPISPLPITRNNAIVIGKEQKHERSIYRNNP